MSQRRIPSPADGAVRHRQKEANTEVVTRQGGGAWGGKGAKGRLDLCYDSDGHTTAAFHLDGEDRQSEPYPGQLGTSGVKGLEYLLKI